MKIPVRIKPDLDHTERCDRCSAQAVVMVLVPQSGEEFAQVVPDEPETIELNAYPMTFCGHHYKEYQPVLPPETVVYADDRHTLA